MIRSWKKSKIVISNKPRNLGAIMARAKDCGIALVCLQAHRGIGQG